MSFKDQVASLAMDVMRDPAASPEDRRAARAALVDGGGTAVSQLRQATAKLTPEDRAAVLRFAALVADPTSSYAPPAARVMTVREHLAAMIALDPELIEVRKFGETLEQADQELERSGISTNSLDIPG